LLKGGVRRRLCQTGNNSYIRGTREWRKRRKSSTRWFSLDHPISETLMAGGTLADGQNPHVFTTSTSFTVQYFLSLLPLPSLLQTNKMRASKQSLRGSTK
jgi:hypothetical protein